MGEFDPLVRFTQSPVARLATVAPDGRPHLVPVVFALDDDRGVVYTAVDAKPKTTQRLRRLANIESNPQVSLLVDHYADDWTRLWWVRVDGTATVHEAGGLRERALDALQAKYAPYREARPHGPLLVLTPTAITGWSAR